MLLKEFLEAIEYKITEGSDYGWDCYGPDSRYLDCQGPIMNEDYSISCIFDSKDQTVYAIEAWDYRNDREYRWINPGYVAAFNAECRKRNIDPKESFDDHKYIELEVEEDILEKINGIVNNEDYDTGIMVPLHLDKEQLYDLMLMAHEKNITLNQMVEEVLWTAIEKLENENQTSK